jgi:hypothetical protein
MSALPERKKDENDMTLFIPYSSLAAGGKSFWEYAVALKVHRSINDGSGIAQLGRGGCGHACRCRMGL